MIAALPALIAMVAKLWILWTYRHNILKQSFENTLLLMFLGFLALHNVAEIGVYVMEDLKYRILLMDGWYVFAIFSIATATTFAIAIFNERIAKYVRPVMVTAALILALSIVFTDFVIMGYKNNGSVMTKVAGQHYYLYQIFALASCLTMLVFFMFGAFSANMMKKVKSVMMLLGLLPFVLIIAVVITAQQMGSSIHAGAAIPIAMTFFLWVLTHASSKDRLLNPLVFIPIGAQHRKLKFVIDLLKEKSKPEQLKPQRKALENILIEDAMIRSQGIQKKAAADLGISTAKISNSLRSIKNANQQKE